MKYMQRKQERENQLAREWFLPAKARANLCKNWKLETHGRIHKWVTKTETLEPLPTAS